MQFAFVRRAADDRRGCNEYEPLLGSPLGAINCKNPSLFPAGLLLLPPRVHSTISACSSGLLILLASFWCWLIVPRWSSSSRKAVRLVGSPVGDCYRIFPDFVRGTINFAGPSGVLHSCDVGGNASAYSSRSRLHHILTMPSPIETFS